MLTISLSDVPQSMFSWCFFWKSSFQALIWTILLRVTLNLLDLGPARFWVRKSEGKCRTLLSHQIMQIILFNTFIFILRTLGRNNIIWATLFSSNTNTYPQLGWWWWWSCFCLAFGQIWTMFHCNVRIYVFVLYLNFSEP